MAIALAYLGSLGFAAYLLWLRREDKPKADQLHHLRRTLDELGKAHVETSKTVSTLALKAGLEIKKRAA
jgi:hypothetical protein